MSDNNSPNSQSPTGQGETNPQHWPSNVFQFSQMSHNPYSQYGQMPPPPYPQFPTNSYYGYPPQIPQNYYTAPPPSPYFMAGSSQPPVMRSSPPVRTPSTSVSESRPNINEEATTHGLPEEGLTNMRLQGSEETARRSKKQSPRKQNAKWNEPANTLLISSWLNTSKDSVVGIDQTSNRFWDRIATYFNNHLEEGDTRTGKQCKDHWNKMNQKVLRFNGCYSRVLNLHHSGWSEDKVIDESHRMYRNENGNTEFILQYCWTLLRNEPKWKACYVPEGCKRTKVSETGAYTSSSNPDRSEDDCREVRPMGQKAAKRKGKQVNQQQQQQQQQEQGNYDTMFLDKLERKTKALEQMVEIERKKAEDMVEIERKKAEDTNKLEMMKYLLMDTSHMTEQQKIDHDNLCEVIRQQLL